MFSTSVLTLSFGVMIFTKVPKRQTSHTHKKCQLAKPARQQHRPHESRRSLHKRIRTQLQNRPCDALLTYQQMLEAKVTPSRTTFFLLFLACARCQPPATSVAHRLVSQMDHLNVKPSRRTIDALLLVFSRPRDSNWHTFYKTRYLHVL